MALRLRALATLGENVGSVPRTHTVVPNHLQLQFEGIQCSLLTPYRP